MIISVAFCDKLKQPDEKKKDEGLSLFDPVAEITHLQHRLDALWKKLKNQVRSAVVRPSPQDALAQFISEWYPTCDVHETDSLTILIMEFVEGETLDDFLYDSKGQALPDFVCRFLRMECV